MHRRIIIWALIVLTPLLAYYGFTYGKKFFAIDKCLDLGGAWNYKLNKCEYEEIDNPNIITLSKNYSHIKEVIENKDFVLQNHLEKEYGTIIGFDELKIMDEKNATVNAYQNNGSVYLKIKLIQSDKLVVTMLGLTNE